jgi:alkylhydroperoxidase/carboxymuconolactone decarboxylase family protein YurZ
MTNEHRHPPPADFHLAVREHAPNDGVIPAKYRALMAMVVGAVGAHPDEVKALIDGARAAGASEAEIAEAAEVGGVFGGRPMARVTTRRARQRGKVKAAAALWLAALVVGAVLFVPTAPLSWGDVCGGGANVPAGGCPDPGVPAGDPPASQGAPAKPPWLGAIEHRDPQFADSYLAMRERILKDGAIPAKYKFLMAMVTDAIAAHPDGVRTLAGNARAAGASEPEVTEAVEVGYLFGGTAALVMGANAFNS